MASDGPSPHSPYLHLGHTVPQPSRAATPNPCWAPHFMTQERLMFSNPTPSEPRLFPAATMSDDMQSALTPPLHCASILQPAAPELFTYTFVLQGSPSTSSRQPQTTHVFADSWIGLLCHVLHICVAHALPESCPSFLLVH